MKIIGYIDAIGDEFSPIALKLIEGFNFTLSNEPNEIGSKGRYKDQPIPFGFSRIEIPIANLDSFFDGNEKSLMEQIAECLEIVKQSKATDISIHFNVEYEGQCNLQFDPKWMVSIGQLGVPITLTTYER